jgi:hypothetical protein
MQATNQAPESTAGCGQRARVLAFVGDAFVVVV